MSRQRHYDTPTAILRRLKEGRGDSKPWTEVKDVPSRGRSHRLTSHKTSGLAHLHSDLERNAHFLGEYLPTVRMIRHQCAMLPLGETMAIAAELGVAHSTHPETRFPFVMTTDQIWTVTQEDGSLRELAINIKYSAQRDTRRNKEKRQIEEVFQGRRGRMLVDFDEEVVSSDFIVNWGFIRVLLRPEYHDAARDALAEGIDRLFRGWVQDRAPTQAKLVAKASVHTGASPTAVISALHWLIARRIWLIDIFNGRLGPSLPYHFLTQ